MMAQQQTRTARPGTRQTALAAMPGAVVSLLGPYRPSMDPVQVFIGGRAPAATPAAPALASTGNRPVTLPATSGQTTVIITPGPPVAAGVAPGAIRGSAAPADGTPVRHGAIAPAAGAPLLLNGALPPERPAAAPARPAQRATPAARQNRTANVNRQTPRPAQRPQRPAAQP